VGERDASIWQPRVVCLDASVGLDGILATFKQEKGEGDHQEEFIATQSAMHRQAQREEAKQAAASASASSSKKAANANRRPQHWADLAKGVMPFHPKSSYSVPGLYEGTSDFHLHEQGKEIMEREAIVSQHNSRAGRGTRVSSC
jgi:hypothetical protein